MPDYRKLVQDKEKLENELHIRQDNDVHMRNLLRYVLSDALMRPLSGIIHVTLNRPAVFYNNIFTALNNAHEQIIVTSDVKDLDTHEIEDFRKAGFNAANARLRKQGRFLIEPFIDEQSSMRGRAASLVLFQMINEKLVEDIRMWDTRYLSFEMGDDGINWAGVNEKRDMDLIIAQYPDEIEHFKINTSQKDAKVLDVWHKEGNEVWVDEKKILEQEHSFGFTPVVIETVTLGSMLSDPDSLVRRGESIYFLIRDIIPLFNRLASVITTQMQTRVKPPIQTPSQSKSDEPPAYEDVMDMGSSSVVGSEGFTQMLDTGDINRAAQMLLTIVSTALDEGSVSTQDIGLLGSPTASGVALMQAKERRDITLSPRLEVKSQLKLGIGDMFTEQIKQMGVSNIELDNRTFKVSDLEGQYQVKHKYVVKSNAVDAAMASLAAAYAV